MIHDDSFNSRKKKPEEDITKQEEFASLLVKGKKEQELT